MTFMFFIWLCNKQTNKKIVERKKKKSNWYIDHTYANTNRNHMVLFDVSKCFLSIVLLVMPLPFQPEKINITNLVVIKQFCALSLRVYLPFCSFISFSFFGFCSVLLFERCYLTVCRVFFSYTFEQIEAHRTCESARGRFQWRPKSIGTLSLRFHAVCQLIFGVFFFFELIYFSIPLLIRIHNAFFSPDFVSPECDVHILFLFFSYSLPLLMSSCINCVQCSIQFVFVSQNIFFLPFHNSVLILFVLICSCFFFCF